MNVMTEWLENYFYEVEPNDFYREIFPEKKKKKKGEYREKDSD